MTKRRPLSSRERYRAFVEDYRHKRLDDSTDAGGANRAATPATVEGGALPAPAKPRSNRRKYVRDYLRWLKPHRYAVAAVFVLALVSGGLQMVEPLFMRFIIDRVLNLPLPKLWEMKTGGILSRLTGDIDTTTGLLQMAIVSPAVSFIRLIMAVAVLVSLNWRLALMALAIIPGVVLMSLTFSRRVRPIYRSLRKDAETIDGRVGETFSGIRVVRAFRAETRERLDYLRGRHTVLRKELFAHRRELVLWTSWSLLLSSVNVVIVWYGGYLNIRGRASIGDIMAFQWYTFLLLNPVWSIVNSFSALQRWLAAMERVFELLATEADKPDRPEAQDAQRLVREIRF